MLEYAHLSVQSHMAVCREIFPFLFMLQFPPGHQIRETILNIPYYFRLPFDKVTLNRIVQTFENFKMIKYLIWIDLVPYNKGDLAGLYFLWGVPSTHYQFYQISHLHFLIHVWFIFLILPLSLSFLVLPLLISDLFKKSVFLLIEGLIYTMPNFSEDCLFYILGVKYIHIFCIVQIGCLNTISRYSLLKVTFREGILQYLADGIELLFCPFSWTMLC